MTQIFSTLGINWTTIISGAINSFILGIAIAAGTVFGTRYTVRVLDRVEKNGKDKKNE